MIKAKHERPLPTIKVTEGVPDDSMICRLQQITMKENHTPAIKTTVQHKKALKAKSSNPVRDSFSNITYEAEINLIPKMIHT